MLNLDSFFVKHGEKILRFKVKVGTEVDTIEFSKEYILGADRVNPWALQERLDTGSAKMAMYGTLHAAAMAELRDKKNEFKAWYARIHRETKAAMLQAISGSALGYGLKKAPTGEDIENEILAGEYGPEVSTWKQTLADLEKNSDQMQVLYEASKLDADAARSMSSMGKSMLERDLIGQGGPSQQRKPAEPGKPQKPHDPDADF